MTYMPVSQHAYNLLIAIKDIRYTSVSVFVQRDIDRAVAGGVESVVC